MSTFLLLCSLFCTAVVWADTCADDNYKLTTQLEVNQLGSTGCDRVAGDLEIVDSPDIYNLEPLASIDEIQGALTISGNTALLNLDGLLNVATAASVSVESNVILTNIDGLVGLRQVGSLTIASNPKLKDVEGLARFASASGDVTFDSNPVLTNLNGLNSLIRVGGALSIEGNDALLDIDGLASLILVGTAITIKENQSLTNIEGLSSLIAVTAVIVSGSASAGGSISPDFQQVLPGSQAQFSIIADTGFYVGSVSGTCSAGSLDGTSYITGEITTDCSVVVDFTTIPTFVVAASAGTGGSIAPLSLNVEEGGTGSFTITTDDDFSIESIGGTCPRGILSATTYVTGSIETDCTVAVSFSANNPSDYCSGTPEGVVCDPEADGKTNPGGTLDSWDGKTWGFENTPIPSGKVVAYPFLANAGAMGGDGILEFSNNMPDLSTSDYSWRGWFSETPGGAVLNNNDSYCRKYSFNPNPQQMKWSQLSNPGRFKCDLGQAERVLYFNMEVGCYEEVLANVPEADRNCTVGAPWPGVANYDVYYIKVYPR